MSTGPKRQGRGGTRPGAGRPRTLTQGMIDKLIKTAKKWERENKKSIDDILMELIYDKDPNGETVPHTVRMKGIQVYKDNTQAKMKEDGGTDERLGPGIFIPEQLPDPALKVVK